MSALVSQEASQFQSPEQSYCIKQDIVFIALSTRISQQPHYNSTPEAIAGIQSRFPQHRNPGCTFPDRWSLSPCALFQVPGS